MVLVPRTTNASHFINTTGATATAAPMKEVIPKEVDELLTREMRQLTFQDRNEIQEEMHGVRGVQIDETPIMLSDSLVCLSRELELISNKPAYDRAQTLPRSYVNDSDLRLRFLRCEEFDAAKAAKRMVGFLDLLFEYFGLDALKRPVKISDLSKTELDMLRAGQVVQCLPFRDRSGRRILTLVGDFGLKYDYDARVRVYLYMFCAISDDIETQRRGVVYVIWPGPTNDLQLTFPDKKEHIVGSKIFATIPVRICAIHFCYRDGPVFRMIKACFVLMIGNNRSRIQFDSGDGTEITYKLMGYGIPVDLLPMTETGNVKTKNLLQWMKVRKYIESHRGQQGESIPVECPFMNDVVIRFGKAYPNHPGTQMFRGILESMFEEHKNAKSVDAKVEITWRIVDEVERKGGRFLVWDNRGWWVQLTDRAQIRSKVAVSMKDHTKRIEALKKQHQVESSTFQFERQDMRKRKRGGVDDGNDACDGACIL